MSQVPPNSSAVQADAHAPAKPGVAKRRIRILMGLLIVGVIAGVAYWLYSRNYESTDNAFIDGHVVYVSPKVAGQVVKLNVADNQQVPAGYLLVEIDPRDYEVRLAQAVGALEAAKARKRSADINVGLTGITAQADVEAATAGLGSANAALAGARSNLEQAKAAVNTAQATMEQDTADIAANEADAKRTADDLERYRQLIASDSTTKQQFDLAQAASQSAQAKLQAARKKVDADAAKVEQAQASVVAASESINQAQALVAQAQARLDQVSVAPQRVDVSVAQRDTVDAEIQQLTANVQQAQLALSYTKVTAPQDGRVTKRTIEQGAFVQVGQPMMAIVPEQVWVVANFKETQLTHMRPGQRVAVKVDAYPGEEFKAHVDSIQEGTGARFSLLPPENATGNYVKVVQRVPVKIVFDEPLDSARTLAPGMSVVPKVKVR